VDVEVVMTTELVYLIPWSPPVTRAAEWLRQHLGKSEWESVDTEFAEYFHCELIKKPGSEQLPRSLQYVAFEPAEATAFLLRWS
jgi:hypothetical protein